MIHHISKIKATESHATIFFFGDLQMGQEGFSKEIWQEFKNKFQRTKNAWALGVGDYGDFLRPSMRGPLINALTKDDSARQMVDSQILHSHDKIIDAMQFLDRRLLGLHEGHHNWTFMSGLNTDQRLASALHAPYLGWSASTRIVMDMGRTARHTQTYTMITTHGNANGRKVPAALSWMENNLTTGFIADQYVMGHGCKSGNDAPFQRNTVRRKGPAGMIQSIPRCMVIGGFSKGYTDGWHSSYVEKNGFTPQPLGWGEVYLYISYTKADGAAHGIEQVHGDKKILMAEQKNIVYPA